MAVCEKYVINTTVLSINNYIMLPEVAVGLLALCLLLLLLPGLDVRFGVVVSIDLENISAACCKSNSSIFCLFIS